MKALRTRGPLLIILASSVICFAAEDARAQILGTAETYGVLAGSTVTNTGFSGIQGNVGVSPGGAVVGFPRQRRAARRHPRR